MPSLPLKFKPEDLEGPPSSLYEGIEYDEFWKGMRKQKIDQLERTILRNLLPESGRRILDVGCGFGRLADCYVDRFQQVVMIDGSMSLLHQAREMTKGHAVYIAADASNIPFTAASFNAVLMIRVFHHIQDSAACLAELHRLLCKDGQLIFTFANRQSIWRTIKWVIGTNKESPFIKQPAGLGTRLISHHPKHIDQMLRDTGFSRIKYYGEGILDRFADRSFVGRWTFLNWKFAPLFGSSKIAPWIFCDAITEEKTELNISRGIGDLLQCPCCGSRVTNDDRGYLCISCQRYYPVVDGILDMRV